MDSTINLDDSIKEVIKKDKVVNVTLDKEEIKNYVKDDLLFFDSNIEGNIYKYYVLKFEKDFFHVDCASIIDPLKSIKDKLNELVNRDYSEYKDTKTTDSYNNLIDRVNNNGSINNINISSSDGNKFNLSFSEYLKLIILHLIINIFMLLIW